MSNNSEYVINFTKNRKNNLIQIFGSKCCLCGFNKWQEALEFHHVNPEEKEFGLSSNVMKSIDKQISEARKCILVCSNCHKGIHANYLKVPDNYEIFFNEEVAQNLLDTTNKVKNGIQHYCKNCGKIISKNAKLCDSCSRLESRLVERPNREELKKLIREKPFTQISNIYKVSDNAIRKWCIGYNLPSKKTDIKKFSNAEWEKI